MKFSMVPGRSWWEGRNLTLRVSAGWLGDTWGKKMSAFFGLPGLLLINFQQDVSATCLFLET